MNDKNLSKELAFPNHRPDLAARNKARRVRIALIDPRPLTRASFSDLLKTSSRDFAVTTFSSVEEFLNDFPCPENAPLIAQKRRRTDTRDSELNLVVLNIDAQEVSADPVQDGVRKLRQMAPNVPLIVLADRENADRIVEAFRNGASGYIPTSLTPSVAIAALRLILAGGRYIPEAVMHEALDGRLPHLEEHLSSSFDPEILDGLTERQQEVLHLLRRGKSNKLIAYEIGVQESTVKVHVREIMKKLHATNRTHAAYIAERIPEFS